MRIWYWDIRGNDEKVVKNISNVLINSSCHLDASWLTAVGIHTAYAKQLLKEPVVSGKT